MGKFLLKIAAYLVLFMIIALLSVVILSSVVVKRDFQNHETESNLLFLENDNKYDILIMGISHARNFSRHNNHQRLESILNKRLVNIGQGNGACGINEQQFYLDYFYHLDNEVDQVVFVISPPLFFSETLPVASNTFDFEPFRWSFLSRYMSYDSENKNERIMSYLQTKIGTNWLRHYPKSLSSQDQVLKEVDSAAIISGQQTAFNDNERMNMDRFNLSAKRVEETIDLALKNNSEVILLIPPTIFGKWEGHHILEEFSEKMTEKEGVSYYDFSEVINDPSLFYDHHHLNTKGVEFFTRQYLLPMFGEELPIN